MKKINQTVAVALIVIALMCTSSIMCSTFAQQTFTYLFASSPITSMPPGGPILEPIGTTTTPVEVIIPATTCADMPLIDLTHFERNAGFKAKAFFTDNYSIEMIFRFEELNGYNRIIDFSNSVADYGIYTFSDCLNFYPTGNVGPCPAFDTTNYKQIVITRNDSNGEMNVYVNGVLFTNHIDVENYYVIGAAPNDSIKFFKDDLSVGNEASPGNVALIRMCDFVLSPQQINDSYLDFCTRLSGIDESTGKVDVSIYPNPVSDQLTIQSIDFDFSKEIQFTVVNTIGQRILQIPICSEATSIELGNSPSGVYFYEVQIGEAILKTGKIIIH